MSPWPPAVPVAGVDGCRGGWLAVAVPAAGPRAAEAAILPGAAALAALPVAAAAVDMPIGLLDTPQAGGRAADRAARAFLSRRNRDRHRAVSARVFAAPARAHLDRLDRGFDGCNAGFPAGARLSRQAFGIAAPDAILAPTAMCSRPIPR